MQERLNVLIFLKKYNSSTLSKVILFLQNTNDNNNIIIIIFNILLTYIRTMVNKKRTNHYKLKKRLPIIVRKINKYSCGLILSDIMHFSFRDISFQMTHFFS